MPYVASDFPRLSGLNGNFSLKVLWRELLWASITVGKARHDVLNSGQYSLAEAIHRIACFSAYYRVDEGRLTLAPTYLYLDPTEKSIVSFYTGMAMAKVYAEKSLGVPWLMHISRYAAPWAVRYGSRSDRPDLFGCNANGHWVVAEAKGRSRVTNLLIAKMKNQKSAVATINGAPPLYRFGSATRIEAQRLSLRVVDPPASRQAQDLPINPAAWLTDYYGPITDLIEQSGPRREGEIVVAQVPGTDIEIGLSQDIVRLTGALRERRPTRPAPRARRRPRPQASGTDSLPVSAARDEVRAALPRLEDQMDDGNRDLVEQVAAAADRDRAVEGGLSDGVIVRTRRG